MPNKADIDQRARSDDGRKLTSRRQFLATGALALLTPGWRLRAASAADQPLASFDREMESFMEARGVPGGALAVVKEGRLVYARGYGLADRERKVPVRAKTLFRVASVSKPFTAVAVLRLIQDQRLRLEDRVFGMLALEPVLRRQQTVDPRLSQITVRNLLQHTGGWDREKSGDPMFRPLAIARATGTEPPARPEAIIRYMLGQPLDFDPGARFAYSNFGYCVLGRIIEKVTGVKYETFLRERMLAPIGIKAMRVGGSLASGEGEAHYYMADGSLASSVFPDVPGPVAVPYGSFYLEALDAHGGWIASVVDLARFAAALDDPDHSILLKPESLKQMYAPPPPPVSRKQDGSLEEAYYACGWNVRPVGKDGRANYWHDGSLPGTSSLLVRRWDGLSWAVVFNQRSDNKKLPDGAIDGALHRAAAAVKTWPQEDLFSSQERES